MVVLTGIYLSVSISLCLTVGMQYSPLGVIVVQQWVSFSLEVFMGYPILMNIICISTHWGKYGSTNR